MTDKPTLPPGESAQLTAKGHKLLLDVPQAPYEDGHPKDEMILWSASDHRDLIEVVEVLGIQDRFQTPAEAVRELHAEIERLRVEIERAHKMLDKWNANRADYIGDTPYDLSDRIERLIEDFEELDTALGEVDLARFRAASRLADE